MIPFTSCMCPARKRAGRRSCRLVAPQKGASIEVEESDEPGFCFYPKGALDSPKVSRKSRYQPCYIARRRARRPVITPVNDLNLLDDTYSGVAQVLLSKCNHWSFNTFNLDVSTGGRSLPFLLVHLFHEYGFINYFQLDVVKVWRCFSLMEAAYHRHNPYHNSVHAADVTQAMHCFLQENKFAKHLTPLEAMASIIAAVAHDLDHPGVTQTFLVSTSNHLVNLYHNSSVLENHHWRTAVSCLLESEIFSHLEKDLWFDVQNQIRSLILATDITRQKEFLSRFKGYLNSQVLDMEKAHYRHFALQIALKCADLCNPCRPWGISQRWSYQVCQEFYRQGSFERQLNLPLTPTFDCSQTRVPKIQTDFFQHVVIPLFDTWDSFLETQLSSQLLKNLKHNYSQWQRKMELIEKCDRPDNISPEDYLPLIRADFGENSEQSDVYARIMESEQESQPSSSEIHLEAYSTEELQPLTTLLSLTSTKSMISLRKACIISEGVSHLVCPLVIQPLSLSSSLSDCPLDNSDASCVDTDLPFETTCDVNEIMCDVSGTTSNEKAQNSSVNASSCCSPLPATNQLLSDNKEICITDSSCFSNTVIKSKQPENQISEDIQLLKANQATSQESNDRTTNPSDSNTSFHSSDYHTSLSAKQNATKTSLCSTKNVQRFIAPVKLTASWCWHIRRSLSAERSRQPCHDLDSLFSNTKGGISCQTCHKKFGRRGSAPAPIVWGRDTAASQTSSLESTMEDKMQQEGETEICGSAVRRWSIPLEPISS